MNLSSPVFELRQLPMPLFNKTAIIAINFIAITLILTVINHFKVRQKKSLVFLVLGVSILAWVDFAYAARIFGNMPDISILFLKGAWFATPLVFFFTYMTSTLLAERENSNRFISPFLLAIALLLATMTVFTNLTIENIRFTNQILDIVYGKGFYPYLAGVFITILFTLIPLIRTRLEPAAKVFLVGVVIFYIANIAFNIVLPAFLGITHLYFLGDYSTIILLGLTAYAILKLNLFDIRAIAAEIFTLIIWTILFTRIFFAQNPLGVAVDTLAFVLTVIFGILLVRSIYKLKETEDREIEKARELLKLKDEFVFIATHDLRTPVTAIDGYISLIKEDKPQFSPAIEKNFAAVEEASGRLKQLVNDLLEVARGESGTIKVDVSKLDINELIDRVVREVKPSADEKNVQLQVSLDQTNRFVMGDTEKLAEVVENLMSNAVKFSKAERASISVSTKRDGDMLFVIVADNGYGIPKEEQGKVFQKFFKYRGDETQSIPGTGLGLFVVRMLVEKMGGKIGFTSEKGVGTTFTFTIPVAN